MVAGERAGEAAGGDVRTGSNLLVLGSSAGGIEALSRVVSDLPTDLPAAVVIAQHLDPRRSSHLAEILQRHTALPIRVIDGATPLEDGVIFVVPANRLVEVTNEGLRLRPARRGAIAPSIDLLFTSAAKTHGARVVAVVLTGTGSDGSAGAWNVKQAGGTVVVENPETAMFASMPASVSPSLVDAKADLDALGNVIAGILEVIERPAEPGHDDAFGRLLDRIRDRSGIDFSAYKPATIVRRLEGRMRATGSADIGAYSALVEQDAAEYDRLIGSLLIKITGFLRDARLIAELRLSNSAMLRSSEDAQAGREEVETLNEEFQATNEEHETLNEELTATVEELRIANEDLAARTEDLRLQSVAIEQQKRATEEEHDRLGSILASIGDAVVAVDHDGKTVLTNVVYDRLFGGPEAEMRLEDVAGLPFLPEDRPQRRAARGERFRIEFAVSDPDGQRHWFEAVAEPLTVKDRTWGGVVSIRDVSERTMRLSLERLMGAAGHELKTPTAAIHNYLQLIARRLASGDADDAALYTGRAMIQAQRLDELVDRLFDVTRIRSGRLEIVTGRVDLAAIVREATDVSSVLINAPLIEFSAKPASIPIQGDAGRLEQVFLNLVANAIEHATGSGSIEVSVRRSGAFAAVAVRDHGRGIAAEDLPVLFEAYTRLGQPQNVSGLGLGLFVAREIIAAHGGSITVTSEIGTGTTFTVRLPAEAPAKSTRGRARKVAT